MSKKTSIISVFGSMLAGLGLLTCCGTPILVSILSVVGIGASQLEFFAKNQEIFLFISLLSLLIGFYQVYFKNKNSSCCSSQPAQEKKIISSKSSKIMLWSSSLIVIIVLILSFNKDNKSEVGDKICCPIEKSQEACSCS